jgi:hypothetical protein
MYHGLARRFRTARGFLVRPQLDSGTLAGRDSLMTTDEKPTGQARVTRAVDEEIEAIHVVLGALEALQPPVRQAVLEYVLKRLKLPVPFAGTPIPAPQPVIGTVDEVPAPPAAVDDSRSTGAVHIRTFKDEKKPRSANEMAALVAYYLENLASERKKTVNTKDIETYFKIANFPLPGQVRVTLPNAKAAGYFDPAGDGEYRLNAIGHNLVVHSMPRGANSPDARPKRKKAKRPSKRPRKA